MSSSSAAPICSGCVCSGDKPSAAATSALTGVETKIAGADCYVVGKGKKAVIFCTSGAHRGRTRERGTALRSCGECCAHTECERIGILNRAPVCCAGPVCVSLSSDIFGWKLPNLRVIAESYAATGEFTVVIPNYLRQ